MSGCGFPPVRLRLASGLKSSEVAERLMVSQPEISHLESGRRTISPCDVRDVYATYGVTDPQVIDSLNFFGPGPDQVTPTKRNGRRTGWGRRRSARRRPAPWPRWRRVRPPIAGGPTAARRQGRCEASGCSGRRWGQVRERWASGPYRCVRY
ncbi:helix-turn-helix domain-containing protein [Streptomyces capillispiralis]|uniref:helix-turn-helix domain-containing protein n=1 Tax=Streptomyces capillispiralis TaxID=68182 RepID=UPI00369C01E0